ncbi:MAG: hypothetical protein ACXVEE_42780 [Polyangiales bacterium]
MSLGAPRSTRTPESGVSLGNFLGTGLRGGIEWFVEKHGPAAVHAAVTKLSPDWRRLVDPHDKALGILGARKYPYAFVGELMRAMAAAVRTDEDRFLAAIGPAGVDATLNTVARVLLKYAISPAAIAARAQEAWNVFHDAGRLTVIHKSEFEYTSTLTEWPNHDVTVCKLCLFARRRVIERTGAKNVEVTRTKCLAWGHDCCAFRVRWA